MTDRLQQRQRAILPVIVSDFHGHADSDFVGLAADDVAGRGSSSRSISGTL